MKIKTAAACLLALIAFTSTAKAHELCFSAAIIQTVAPKDSSLTGIYLYPDPKKKSFMLEYSQQLKEPALLELMDQEGNVVFSKQLHPADKDLNKPMKVGQLKSGVYLVEVRTSDTTYWTRLKVTF